MSVTTKNYIRNVYDALKLGLNSGYERGDYIFRGQINNDWELKPKLFKDYPENAHTIEAALCRHILNGNRSPFTYTFDPIEFFINLQHFEIPTRLLDWTSDLLVALFFACYDETNEFTHKDGNLYIIERVQYTPFNFNSIENKLFENPISHETTEHFKKRLRTEDIHVFEPVIKNPRLRVQDGCFMYFPFLPLSHDNPSYVSLHEYMRAKNKLREEDSKIWIGNIEIDKDFKKSILIELDEKYGISKSTLFIESKYIKEVSQYYTDVYNEAKIVMEKFKSKKI